MKSLFLRLINSSNYPEEPARLRACTATLDVIRGEALGPQNEDTGRTRETSEGEGERGREKERSGFRSRGRFIREFIRFHVATE